MYTNNLGNICCTTVDYNAHKPYQQLSKMDKFLVAWIPLLRAKTSAFNLTQHSRHSNNANRFSLFTAFQISLGKWFNILNFNENIITRGFTAGLLLLIIGQHLDRQISFFPRAHTALELEHVVCACAVTTVVFAKTSVFRLFEIVQATGLLKSSDCHWKV